MRFTALAGLVSLIALGADGHAESAKSVSEVVDALERIRETSVFPEYLSLEYVDLHRAVAGIVERDPHGYVTDLAARVLTRVVVNLEQPLIPADEAPALAVDLLGGPGPGQMHRADFYGSLDGGPWRLVAQLGYGAAGSAGRVLCDEDSLGTRACAPGWHAIAMRVGVSAWTKESETPVWSETRALPTQVYGVYRKRELLGSPRAPGKSSTPAAWMRAVLDLPASSVDSQLGPVPLRSWLPSALSDAGKHALALSLRWEPRPCGVDMVERFADRSRAPVCIIAIAKTHELEVRLEFSLGPLADETGRRRWPEPPTFHQGYLEDQRGSLDLSRLAELPGAFDRPRTTWPTADLRIQPTDIVYTPLVPDAGDTVTVEFGVQNAGAQHARALIEFWLYAPGLEQEDRLDFVADVPAGRYYRFTRSIRVPQGSATGFAGLQAQLAPPRGSIKRIEESNGNNNDVVRLLGELRRVRVP
ncbi:MAG TPA: hypothetical protein VH679_00805 [Vicinamibacterales bacterium]